MNPPLPPPTHPPPSPPAEADPPERITHSHTAIHIHQNPNPHYKQYTTQESNINITHEDSAWSSWKHRHYTLIYTSIHKEDITFTDPAEAQPPCKSHPSRWASCNASPDFYMSRLHYPCIHRRMVPSHGPVIATPQPEKDPGPE